MIRHRLSFKPASVLPQQPKYEETCLDMKGVQDVITVRRLSVGGSIKSEDKSRGVRGTWRAERKVYSMYVFNSY